MAKKIDPASEAALSTIDAAIKRGKIKEAEQKKKEKLIAQTYEIIGKIKTADMFAKTGHVSSLMWLKEVKESEIYKDIDGMGSWESFCNYLGKSRRHIDRDLENLKVFGAEFLDAVSSFKLGYKELRKLQGPVKDGGMTIEGGFVVIGDEKIPLSPDSKDDLEAAFESLVEVRDRKIEDFQTAVKVKDRMLGEKERVIQKQEKELSKFTKEIKERDYKPGEEDFIKQMENKQMTITGLFLELDIERLPEDATPLMISKYIEVLSYFKRTAHTYLDMALEDHAQPDDIKWEQPGLKDVTVPSSGELSKQVMKLVGE